MLGGWRLAGMLVVLALAASAAMPAVPQAPPTTVAPATEGPKAVQPIPIPVVASEAEDTVAHLRTIEAGALPTRLVQRIEERLPQLEHSVSDATRETYRVLKQNPTVASLDGLLDPWTNVQEQARAWVALLTRRAEELETSLKHVDDIRARWTATKEASAGSDVPEATLGRVEDTLVLIGATRARVEQRRKQVLVLQDRAAQVLARAQEILDQVDAARRSMLGQIFVRDGLPIWGFFSRSAQWQSAREQLGESISGELPVVSLFAQRHELSLGLEGLLFLVLAAWFVSMRRRARRWVALDDSLAARLGPLNYPLASAALVTLLAASQTPPSEPRALQATVALLAMIPIIRLIAALSPPERVAAVWVVGIFHVVDLVRVLLTTTPLIEQGIFVVELVALVSSIAWLRQHLVSRTPGTEGRRRWELIGRIALALASIALVGALLGYLRLARLIEFAMVGAAQWALVLWALVRLSGAIVAWAVRVRPLRLLRAVQEHRERLEQGLVSVMRVVAVVVWTMTLAGRLSILGPVLQQLGSVLGTSVGYGAVRVSLGDVLAFVFVLWLTFIISTAARAVLEEDLFSRLTLGRGVALALSSLLHYAILLVGFLVGLAALGLDLTRITILAGALGVGVGFGLQNVVNNFVSGLILLFERPIQVGDTVQLGTLTGEVKRIGIRSSTVRTAEGAEVIVPNASLVSDQVTNWTLSDRMRRIDLDVGVAYGTDPRQIVELLADVARANPGVLPDPAPIVLFQGFGDSALDFQIRAWTARFEDWVAIRSELGLAVHDALTSAGIDIPFPQRTVHVVQDGDAAMTTNGSTDAYRAEVDKRDQMRTSSDHETHEGLGAQSAPKRGAR